MLGYILTRKQQQINGKTVYFYTGTGEDGPFQIEIDNKSPIFFIKSSTVTPQNLHFKERKKVNLQSFTNEEVDALYFNNISDLYNGKKILKDGGYTCYESDVIAEERYLMERFIYGSVNIDGQSIFKDGLHFYKNPLLTPGEYKPDFRILSMDIETGRNGTIYSIGFHLTGPSLEHKSVLMRSELYKTGEKDNYIEYCNNEKDLLSSFISKFNDLDPDIIIGWHVIGFDLDFIERRLKHYSIPFFIGRDRSTPLIRQSQSGGWHCSINGRVIIDGPPTLRGAFYTFESYSLENVGKEVLGVGKDITGSGKVDEIERRFLEDKIALAHYNLLDCTLVTDIYNKLDLVDLTFTRAITSGMTMDRVGLSVAAFDYFMLPMIHRKGLVAPDIDDMEALNQGSGGLVFIKEPGFYDSIVVLDFKSLYPSIIRTFMIDPLSRIKSETNTLATPVDIDFSKTEHVLPEYIEKLMEQRAQAKKEKNDHLSQSIKILMNSFYGVMGSPSSRFYHPDLSFAITGTGQWLLNKSKDFLEQDDYPVIYGDTDSLFVQLKPEQRLNYNSYALEITQKVNTYLTNFILKEFSLESHLELEYEKHFRKFFLPGIRGNLHTAGIGAKKRYAGLLSSENGEKLSFTGLEFVRSDWTNMAKTFQYTLFELIFNNKDIEPYIKGFVKDLQDGKLDDDLYYKKSLKKPASEYKKILPPQVKASLLLDPSGKLRGRIEYIITLNGPIPRELKPEHIDYNHYIDKQLKPIADSLLPFIDKSFDNIVFNKQPELF